MATVSNEALAPQGIRVIDLQFMGMPEVIAAYLLDAGDSFILIETGPSTSLPALEAGLAAAGIGFDQISHIVVTHIHLDHSGAAGMILRENPHITVLVHPVGAPHLVDPERLVGSAGRIYGDSMERLWGEIVGIDAVRVQTLEDGQRLTIGSRTLRVAFTEGHASHHVVLLDESSGTLFTGDTGGVRIPGTDYVAAPIPPPEVNPEAWAVSLETMRVLAPTWIAPTHFGVYDDPEAHFAQIPVRLADLVALGEAAGEGLSDTEAMVERVGEYQRDVLGEAASADVLGKLELANPNLLGALGLQRLFRKRAR